MKTGGKVETIAGHRIAVTLQPCGHCSATGKRVRVEGRALKAARQDHGLTASAVAKGMGVSTEYIFMLEKRGCTVKTAEVYLSAVNVMLKEPR